MLATFNSWGLEPTDCRQTIQKTWENWSRQAVWMLLLLLSLNLPAKADSAFPSPVEDTTSFARRAEAVFKAAQARIKAQPTNAEAKFQLGRAAFDWAEFANSRSQRAEIAQEGIAAARSLIEQNPDSTAGHYY